jgi:sortase A
VVGGLSWIERSLFTIGLSLLAMYGVIRLEGYLSSQAALGRFATPESSEPVATEVRSLEEESSRPEIGFSSWGGDRVRAHKGSLSNSTGAAIAVVQIPKIHLTVPLLDGTDALTLNHAVGRIAGTAWPGEPGNIGIAGHRDGFFRGLKDIEVGGAIELRTINGIDKYVADKIQIVTPDSLPETASNSPLLVLLGLIGLGSSLGLGAVRNFDGFKA